MIIVGKAIALLKKERSHFIGIIIGRAIAFLKKAIAISYNNFRISECLS
ncbi:hypothetical protein PL11201_80303 [Planktothrix sp. PCC 11201]|nr:hypothetical protein PL11201_80303 [Planktothrix sp. PCC 11201]